jgi:hypothetical protein
MSWTLWRFSQSFRFLWRQEEMIKKGMNEKTFVEKEKLQATEETMEVTRKTKT